MDMAEEKLTESKVDKKAPSLGVWTQCKKCEQMFLQKDFEENFMVCPKCGYYTRLDVQKRIEFTVDEGSFKEFAAD
jgi:acetyl-CoA carboxylase carboxyl transferase subunit beta